MPENTEIQKPICDLGTETKNFIIIGMVKRCLIDAKRPNDAKIFEGQAIQKKHIKDVIELAEKFVRVEISVDSILSKEKK